MKLDKIYTYLVQLIYLSFAFDSLLKVNIGIKIHIGIILILFVNIYNLITGGWQKKIRIPKQDIWLLLFTIYIFFSGVLMTGSSSLFIFFYFLLAISGYIFISTNFQIIKESTFFNFQKILIITGIFQLLAYLIFDYQINFLDVEHYSKGSSVTSRIRGFFVEPNWFAIALTFNTFIIIKNDIVYFFKKHFFLFLFTLLVMLLNGSIGTLVIFAGIYGYKYIRKNIIFAVGLAVMGAIVFAVIFKKRAEVKKNKSGIEIFNYYSRLEPLNRVIHYFEDKPIIVKAFGEGFGSWGTVAVKNRLSVLVYKIDPKSRDGSELPVFLFELGYIGLLLFFLDWFLLFKRNNKKNHYITGALLLFLVCFLLYPIFKFLMYMVYYYVIRVLIKTNRVKAIIGKE